jgi:hypothetical protein
MQPVSSSMSRMKVILQHMKPRLSASPEENGDMSMSCDMENRRHRRGAVGGCGPCGDLHLQQFHYRAALVTRYLSIFENLSCSCACCVCLWAGKVLVDRDSGKTEFEWLGASGMLNMGSKVNYIGLADF